MKIQSIDTIDIILVLLIILTLLLAYCLTTKQRKQEQFIIDCKKYNPMGEYMHTQIPIGELQALKLKCEKANVLPTSLTPKSTPEEVAAAEKKCRIGCYISDTVCKEACKDTNSELCDNCLSSWSCNQSLGNQIRMPCDTPEVQITPGEMSEAIERNTQGINTTASVCQEICGFGAPPAIGSSACTTCVNKYK